MHYTHTQNIVFGGGTGQISYYPNITDLQSNPTTYTWSSLSIFPDIVDYTSGILDCFVHKSTIGDLFYMASVFPVNGSLSSASTHGELIIFNMTNESFVSGNDYTHTMKKRVLMGCTIAVSNDYYNTLFKIGGYVYYEEMDYVFDNSIQMYDIDNDSWSMGPNLTNGLDEMGCHYYQRKIFIFGGIETNYTYTRDIQV